MRTHLVGDPVCERNVRVPLLIYSFRAARACAEIVRTGRGVRVARSRESWQGGELRGGGDDGEA